MFAMNKYITTHLLEKLDKSAYVHEEEQANEINEGVGAVHDSDDDSE